MILRFGYYLTSFQTYMINMLLITERMMEEICHKNWTKHREAHVPSGPRSMRVVHDEIWQCHRQGISVFDHDLNLKRTMACGNISMISDVADVGNGHVILASYDGLYCMSVEGRH